jgi:hypothetical protein
MVKLFAKFFQAVHGAEIVPRTVQGADNGILFCQIHLADRILHGLFSGMLGAGWTTTVF